MQIGDILIWIAGIFSLLLLFVGGFQLWSIIKKGEKNYVAQLKEIRIRKSKVENILDQSSLRNQSATEKANIQKTVRDFIYIDADRLNSFYSQVFEGVAERVIESYEGSLASKEAHAPIGRQSESLEAKVVEASLRTESKVLYDYIYNNLESRIGSRITEPSDITIENYLEKIQGASLLRVHGSAEIEDYQRMRDFLGKFNSLAEAIAYSTVYASNREQLRAAEERIKNITDPNERARERKKFEVATDLKKIAKDLGLWQDEQNLKNLILFSEFFYADGLDITITPSNSEDVVYRGVLDRRWLRIQPNLLRALYGNQVKGIWTIVGEPTFIPKIHEEKVEPEEKEDIVTNNHSPSMRDPYRDMFKATEVFDTMFQESKKRVEIIIAPLAIYREIEISSE